MKTYYAVHSDKTHVQVENLVIYVPWFNEFAMDACRSRQRRLDQA
jgi:hypothetical protein